MFLLFKEKCVTTHYAYFLAILCYGCVSKLKLALFPSEAKARLELRKLFGCKYESRASGQNQYNTPYLQHH